MKTHESRSESVVATPIRSSNRTVNTDNNVTFTVTAYTAGAESTGKLPDDPAYGVTASGARVTSGRTIACPPSLPFGTRVSIEGVGERTCEDRGGAIVEGRLDVYMPKLADALAFGRQELGVTIINEGEASQ